MVLIMQFAQARHREAGDGGVMTDWDQDLSKPVRAELRRVLGDLRIIPAARWCRPEYDTLSGPHSGIGEVRFKKENKQWRPLGFFLPPELVQQIALPEQGLEI